MLLTAVSGISRKEACMKPKLTWKTSLLAAGLSASGSAGLFCLILVLFTGLGPRGAHPLEVGFGMAGGFAMLGVSTLLLALYINERRRQRSVTGILLDFLLLALLFVPFFLLWGEIEALLSRIF